MLLMLKAVCGLSVCAVAAGDERALTSVYCNGWDGTVLDELASSTGPGAAIIKKIILNTNFKSQS